MEANLMEAMKNNIFGTKNVAEPADTFGVSYFVMISTDKMLCGNDCKNLAKESKTKFAAV